jgi:choloylglycine hydrolase
MKKKLLYFYLYFFINLIINEIKIFGCTEICIKAKDGSVVIARTMDFAEELNPKIYVFKNGTFAYLIIGTFDSELLAIQAISETGLMMSALWLSETKFFDNKNKNNNKNNETIDISILFDFVLSNFSSIDEIKNFFYNKKISSKKYKEYGLKEPPIHLSFYDKSGKGIVVEFINEKIKIYDNKVGILTNSPTFDWHMNNLRNYISISNLDTESKEINNIIFSKTGHGNGFFGIPGDNTPPARFVRSFLNKFYADKPANINDALSLGADLIGLVNVILGTNILIKNNESIEKDYTQLTILTDLTNMIWYIKPHGIINYKTINLKDLFKKENGWNRYIKDFLQNS